MPLRIDLFKIENDGNLSWSGFGICISEIRASNTRVSRPLTSRPNVRQHQNHERA
jgi:hypothetical protein